MRVILLIFILLGLIPGQLSSQIHDGIATYSVSADAFAARVKKNNAAKGIQRKSVFESIAQEMHRIELILSFNDSLSRFQRAPGLAVDPTERVFMLAVAFADRGTYFTNIKSKELFQIREYQGELIQVASTLKDVQWELTQEQKKIGSFTCYKAESYVETSAGRFPLIAWYTPEIPFAYGPADYGGTLPGLILELQTNEAAFICKEITLNPKNPVNIEWPKEGATITMEQYKEMNDQLAKSLGKKNE